LFRCGSSRTLLLARDIFGEKPLYYVDHEDYFAFASELHSLANLPGFDPRIDRSAIARYLCFQYVPTPQTIYRSARKLPPASYLTVARSGTITIRPYYSFKTSAAESSERSLDDLADELEAILLTSLRPLRRRLISDVPLGAFLSAGVDSSTLGKARRLRFRGFHPIDRAHAGTVRSRFESPPPLSAVLLLEQGGCRRI
jgi:asparagine synthase (glutamine-hydrolysing)